MPAACRELTTRIAQARKAAAKAAAYAKRLEDIAAMGEAAWKQVDDMIATKKTSEYDQAVALLRDLRALAGRQGEVETAAFKAASTTRAFLVDRREVVLGHPRPDRIEGSPQR